MSSSQSLFNSTFLDDCISKKRTIQEIHESLGIYAESLSNRREPRFAKDGANDLHKRIIEIAKSFKSSPSNSTDERAASFLKPDVFESEINELVQDYGNRIWNNLDDDLCWNRDTDHATIRFYLRCWIVRHAVQCPTATPRKGKARATEKSIETIFLESDRSDDDISQTPSRSNRNPHHIRTTSAPEAPDMIPAFSSKFLNLNVNRQHSNTSNDRSSVAAGKRKATNVQQTTSPGKLPKVRKDVCGLRKSPPRWPHNVYEIFDPVATTAYPHRPAATGSSHQREETCDTDSTYMPQRADTIESDTVLDEDEVMEDTRGILSDVESPNEANPTSCPETPQAGPSGTYQNPHRRDSVVLLHLQSIEKSNQQEAEQNDVTDNTIAPAEYDAARLDDWQKRLLRIELFKLLLSHLNGINQFDADSYQVEAEDRMNTLLYQFWTGDVDNLRERFRENFDRAKAAFEAWMQMRYQLNEFRVTTGYLGPPGEEWMGRLRRMDFKPRAQAGIAYANMKQLASVGGMPWLEPSYDDDLATVFDALTQIEGCNGKEEFGGLQNYNETILQWFR